MRDEQKFRMGCIVSKSLICKHQRLVFGKNMKQLTGTLVISLMLLGAFGIIATFPNLAVPFAHATTQIQINNRDTFEGLTFNTTGIVKYNSTAVTDGHLTVTVLNGTATVKTTTYTITAEVAGHSAVRFILYAHVKDSANLELAVYLYVDVSNGTVTAYFAARNDDFNQDGIIDINDYSVMQAHYGYCSGNPEFDPETDLNADGCTDINDFSIMSATYGFKAYR